MARARRPGSGSFRTIFESYGQPGRTVSGVGLPGSRTARRSEYVAGYIQQMRGYRTKAGGPGGLPAGSTPAMRAGARRAEDHLFYMNYPKKMMPKAAGRFAVHGKIQGPSGVNPRSATGVRQVDYQRLFGEGRPRHALASPKAGVTAMFKPGAAVPTLKFAGAAGGQGRTRTARRAQYLSGLLQGRLSTINQPAIVKGLARPAAWKVGYLRGAGRRTSRPISGAAKGRFWLKLSSGQFAGSQRGVPKGPMGIKGGRR